MMNRVQAKENAKTILRKRTIADAIGSGAILILIKFVLAISGVLAIGAFSTFLIGIIGGSGSAFAAIPGGVLFLILLFAFCMTAVFVGVAELMNAGMIRCSFRMARGETNVRIADAFLAGDRLGDFVCIFLWKFLITFLWNLPSIVIVLILILGSPSVLLALILLIIAGVWSLFITTRKYCQYFFACYIALDHPEKTALDCVQESMKLTKDQTFDLFVVMLSFLGWWIFTGITLVSIFSVPYMYLTYTHIYQQLRGEFKATTELPWKDNGVAQRKAEPSIKKEAGAMIVVSGEYRGATFPIAEGETIRIGRDPMKANVVTSADNRSISGLHCMIAYDKVSDRYIVTDYSVNGTFVGATRLPAGTATKLNRGTVVELADNAMTFRLV